MVKHVSNSLGTGRKQDSERTNALGFYQKLPVEKSPLYSKYVDILSGLNLEKFTAGIPARTHGVPSEVAHLIRERDEPTLSLQVDSEMVRTEVHGALEKEGIIFTNIASAFTKFPEYTDQYFTKAIPPEDDKFAALNNAFFTAGTFLYVPKGLSVKIPFRNIVFLKKSGPGVFTHNLIVADENSKVTFLQEAYSKLDSTDSNGLYSEVTEVYAGEGSEVNFASLQNFEERVHSLVNRRSIGKRDSKVNWTVGHLGGAITRSRMDSVLDGQGASAEDVEVVFGTESQKFDVVTDLTHQGTHTTGHVLARGIMKDSSRSIFKGMIRIREGAKNSNSYLAEHAMILSKKARADAIPGLEINTNEVKATHSGSVSQIDEEQVYYLQSRGLDLSEAQRLILMGFLHPAVQRIPLRTVRAALQYLIEEKWKGRKGVIPPRADALPEYLEEPEGVTGPTDLFEHHYKYRK
jgi:Fe-S cluster assembly protein SufB/Fe-S cluster assembly protein SufD